MGARRRSVEDAPKPAHWVANRRHLGLLLKRLGRAYSRPFLDLFLFPQKTVDLGLHCPNAFLLPFRHRLSVFDKALDQQVLKLHDPSSLLWR